jgi:hypothetical protein
MAINNVRAYEFRCHCDPAAREGRSEESAFFEIAWVKGCRQGKKYLIPPRWDNDAKSAEQTEELYSTSLYALVSPCRVRLCTLLLALGPWVYFEVLQIAATGSG